MTGGIRAYWTDIRTGEREEVTAGDEPFHDLRYSYHNEAEAQAAADAAKNAADRGKASFSCEVGGRPDVQAEAKLTLAGFRPYIPAEWRIKQVTHRFESGGYTTSITAELFEEQQTGVAGSVAGTTPGEDDLIDEDAPPAPIGGEDLIIDLPE